MKKTVCIIGASGLVGSLLITELLNDDTIGTIKILLRKPIAVKHPKIQQHIVDFTNEVLLQQAVEQTHLLFICIGTTQKKVKGNKELYKQIDVGIPATVAKIAYNNNCSTVSLISAVGANVSSSNFYLQVKGMAENAMLQIGFKNIHIYRPSLIIGNRQESRLAEKIAQLILPLVSIFLIGNWAKYKPIKATLLAKAMHKNAVATINGINIFEYKQIMQSASV